MNGKRRVTGGTSGCLVGPHRSGACWLLLLLLAMPTRRLLAEDLPREEAPLDRLRRSVLGEAWDQLWVPQSRLAGGPHVKSAFRQVVADVAQATVEIRCGGETVALGGIVGADGWILTKGTPLHRSEAISSRFRDRTELPARVVGIDRNFDLAMLKVEATELPVLRLAEGANAEVGHWVATVAPARDPAAVGVVSVGPRKIPNRFGILGVQLEESDEGPRVVQVFPETGAEKAGILINDVIRSIHGAATPTRQDLVRQVRRFSAGDQVEVAVKRGSQELVVKAMLGDRLADEANQDMDQESLSGPLSRRRFDFPQALQHDSLLLPSQCGGPLVNLDGQVVAFNIARAGRTESYAIPTQAILPLLYPLMSGNLAP